MAEKRRYTDEEFALILRSALDAERRAAGEGPRPGGMTLEDMQAVAHEVGVDPEQVARAARLLTLAEEHRPRGLLGGPTKLSAQWSLRRPLAPGEVDDVVSAVRSALEQQGEVISELTAVTWRSVGEIPQLFVTLRPRDTGTEVQVRMDRSVAFTLTWFLTIVAFLVVAGASGDAMAPGGVLGGILYLLSFLAVGTAAARTLWAINSRKAEKRFKELVDAVGAAAADAERLPPAEGPATPGEPPPSDVG